MKWHIPGSAGYRARRGDVITFTNSGVQITYETVVRDGRNFSAINFIGNGGFGETYKVEMVSRLLVANKIISIRCLQGIW